MADNGGGIGRGQCADLEIIQPDVVVVGDSGVFGSGGNAYQEGGGGIHFPVGGVAVDGVAAEGSPRDAVGGAVGVVVEVEGFVGGGPAKAEGGVGGGAGERHSCRALRTLGTSATRRPQAYNFSASTLPAGAPHRVIASRG